MRSCLELLRRIYTVGLRVEMGTEPTHIDKEVLELVLTIVPDVVGAVGTSDHSAAFIDVVLEQPISHLVGRQEVYLQNSVAMGAG